MSDPLNDGAPALQGFQKISRTPKRIRGQAARHPAGGRVYPSGVLQTNVNATDLFDTQAIARGLAKEDYCVSFLGHKDKGLVAALVAPPGSEGATAVRRSADRNTITLYLLEVFADMPTLRPAATRWCSITREPDGADGHYIQVNLSGALEPPPTRHRAKPPNA